ncbi:MAG: hypothetical protein JST63_04905 [Bacteroidetes bacterium]|nr:hypothetical protein [Bacteroidota bacterium]
MQPTKSNTGLCIIPGFNSVEYITRLRKIFVIGIFIISLLFVNSLYAQRSSKLFSFGFGIEGGPIVDKEFKNSYSAEAGLSFRFSLKAGPGFVTFTPGGMVVIPKSVDEDNIKVGTRVPLKIGYKYIIADKLFVMAEGGYSFYTFYTADQNTESADDIKKERDGGFTYAPSVGLNLGAFELGLRYETTILKKSTDVKPALLALRIGFNF